METKFFPFQNFKNYWKRLKTRKVIANWNFAQMKPDFPYRIYWKRCQKKHWFLRLFSPKNELKIGKLQIAITLRVFGASCSDFAWSQIFFELLASALLLWSCSATNPIGSTLILMNFCLINCGFTTFTTIHVILNSLQKLFSQFSFILQNSFGLWVLLWYSYW